jgi:hypothetical protein
MIIKLSFSLLQYKFAANLAHNKNTSQITYTVTYHTAGEGGVMCVLCLKGKS